MCGLFGYIGTSPEWPLLKQVAYEAGRRGPNAWGVAWLNEGRMYVHKRPGKLTEQVSTLPTLFTHPSALIGQSRLATSGTYRTNSNNPPFVVRGITLAHNGNVYNAHELVEQHHLEPETACDSEVLAQLIAAGRGSLLDRVTWAVEQVDGRSPMAVLAMDESGIVAVRKGQPLYCFTHRLEGSVSIYLCSRPFFHISMLRCVHYQDVLDDATAYFWPHDGELAMRREVG